jgi:hypothetical protein
MGKLTRTTSDECALCARLLEIGGGCGPMSRINLSADLEKAKAMPLQWKSSGKAEDLKRSE